MPKMHVEKSVEIDASSEKVYAIVADLGQWRPWNPWLVTEPEAHLVIEPDGKKYSWEGKRTGAGSMNITEEDGSSTIKLDLTFLKPFKSKAKVAFEIKPQGEGCKVTWSMDSSLPFFMFFMKNMMSNMIGMDYDRGLGMLKDFAETGSVPSETRLTGESDYPGCKYVGINTECSFEDMGPQMAEDFKKLQAWQQEAGVEPAGDAFSIYQKWDMSKGRVKFTSGIPVAKPPESLPSGMTSGEIPKLKTFVLEHIGPYRHLGNAWSTGMQMGRNKEFRVSKAYTPFETYPLKADGSLPGGDSNENTRTAIHFAIR